jgi:hypothetical protein
MFMHNHFSKWADSCCDLLEQPEISLQTQPWVLKRGGFVVLEFKVADPGKSIANHQNKQQIDEIEGKEQSEK